MKEKSSKYSPCKNNMREFLTAIIQKRLKVRNGPLKFNVEPLPRQEEQQ